jgi:hypothetical protein
MLCEVILDSPDAVGVNRRSPNQPIASVSTRRLMVCSRSIVGAGDSRARMRIHPPNLPTFPS